MTSLNYCPIHKDYLKASISFEILDRFAHKISDDQAVDKLHMACQKLLNSIHGQTLKVS